MKHKKSVIATLSLISQLGVSMIVPVFLCIFVGIKLEEKIDFPFTILFIILGILAGIRNVYAHKKHLVKVLQQGLCQNSMITQAIDYGRIESPGVIAFNVKNKNSEEIGDLLAQEGIAVRAGLHCAPLFHKKMGTSAVGMVRVSFGYSNTVTEIDRLLEALKFLKF